MNISQILIDHARNRPKHNAVVEGRRVCSYGLLEEVVARGIRTLADRGLERGRRVGLFGPGTSSGLVGSLAAYARGLVPVLLGADLTRPELESAIQEMQLDLVIRHEGHQGWVPEGCLTYEELVAPRPRGRPPREVLEAESAAYRASDPFLLASSSGTTGKPKQILIPGSEMERRSLLSLEESEVGADDRFLCWVLLHFMAGMRRCLMMLRAGGTIVFPHTREFQKIVKKCRITTVYLTPAHLRQLLAMERGDTPRFPHLGLTSSSSPLTAEERDLVRQRITPRFFDAYGTNEVGTLAVARPEDQVARPGANGRIVRGVEAQVVDEEDRPVPAGTPGILRFRHPGFPTSYHLDEASTKLHFRDGWYYPGDIGQLDGDFLHVAGRADDLISNQGLKFYPAEVEAPFRAHPMVKDVAVIGWPCPRMGQAPVACIVPVDGFDADTLFALGHALAPQKRPTLILKMAAIPRNEMGKVLRRELRERLLTVLQPDRPEALET